MKSNTVMAISVLYWSSYRLIIQLVVVVQVPCIVAFTVLSNPVIGHHLHRRRPPPPPCSVGAMTGDPGGFGNKASSQRPPSLSLPPKTYDVYALQPRRDVMDADAAMREFFEGTALEWMPLFQQVTQTDIPPPRPPPTTSDTDTDGSESERGVPFEMDTLSSSSSSSSPWKGLPGIPTLESHRSVLADFLDHVQASLVAIPVDESTHEDENDRHFVEEGRRMLVCGRFHVVPYSSPTNRLDNFDAVFGTCWNEVYQLLTSGEENTGSVILVPDCQSLEDLRRFVDVNVQRPLQWMGLDGLFEVTSFQRGSPAIRLIYRLSDIPTKDLSDETEDNE